jgi:hypothetical protein
LEPGVKDIVFGSCHRKRNKKDELKKYEGDYELAPGIAKFYIKVKKHCMHL